MKSFVAFLRGINVGGRNISMSDLKSCGESIGLHDVRTVLQTGNIIFSDVRSSQLLEKLLANAIAGSFHFTPAIFIYESALVKTVVDQNPWSSVTADSHVYVVFFKNGLEDTLLKEFKSLPSGIDMIQSGKGVVYWRVPKGMTLKSPFAKLLAKASYKDFNTVRNIRTLEKITS